MIETNVDKLMRYSRATPDKCRFLLTLGRACAILMIGSACSLAATLTFSTREGWDAAVQQLSLSITEITFDGIAPPHGSIQNDTSTGFTLSDVTFCGNIFPQFCALHVPELHKVLGRL